MDAPVRPSMLTEGQLFADRYRIQRCIAAGGMGAVYEAVHLETARRRALKVMLPEIVGNADVRDRFMREARVTAEVDSEFIVEVFDAGVDAATQMPFLVMELLRGEDLAQVLERQGPLTPQEVVTWLAQAAIALDKTHAAHIVHRDLKPENLFLTHRDDGSPRIKILDFGISKVVGDASAAANTTRTMGTPLYMAPEQFVGSGICAATDIFALAMIAYTLLVGVPYWQEEGRDTDNVFAFAAISAKGPVEAATARAARQGKQLPAAFDSWFAAATRADSSRRTGPATHMILELAQALGVAAPEFGRASGLAGIQVVVPPVAQVRASTEAGTAISQDLPPTPGAKAKVVAAAALFGLLAVGGAAALFLARSGTASAPEQAVSASAVANHGDSGVAQTDSAAAQPALVVEPAEQASASAPVPQPAASPRPAAVSSLPVRPPGATAKAPPTLPVPTPDKPPATSSTGKNKPGYVRD